MIIEALLWIVQRAKSAMLSFEIDKIQIFDDTIIDVGTVCRWALNDIIIRNADSIIIKYLVWLDRIKSITTAYIGLIVLLFIKLLRMLILILHRVSDKVMCWFNFMASSFSKRMSIGPELLVISIFLLHCVPSTRSTSLISSLSFIAWIKLFLSALRSFFLFDLGLFRRGLFNLVKVRILKIHFVH